MAFIPELTGCEHISNLSKLSVKGLSFILEDQNTIHLKPPFPECHWVGGLHEQEITRLHLGFGNKTWYEYITRSQPKSDKDSSKFLCLRRAAYGAFYSTSFDAHGDMIGINTDCLLETEEMKLIHVTYVDDSETGPLHKVTLEYVVKNDVKVMLIDSDK